MKPTILVVDDEAPIRNMLAFSLNRADMHVDLASGGDEALDHLNTGHDRFVQTVRGHGYRFSDVV